MANIIEFDKKSRDVRAQKDETLRQRKIQLLRAVFQCTRCSLKCAKCGSQINVSESGADIVPTPYPFCDNCREEYIEYKNRVSGKKSVDFYWYNEEWMKVWETWLEHQKSLDDYRKSKEFLKLLNEFKDV